MAKPQYCSCSVLQSLVSGARAVHLSHLMNRLDQATSAVAIVVVVTR